jgi:hypothetical protein
VLLAVALIVSTAVILRALLNFGAGNSAAWNVVAASSAVIAAVVSAWTSTRILERQEDAQLPYPYPYIDASSRYQLLQLRIQNVGGTAARSIRLMWDKPLRNRQGNHVGCQEIPVLMPQHSVAEVIDVDFDFFEREQDANYSGTVLFQDANGRDLQHRFYVSVEQYRIASSYDDEVQKTYYKLQQIPEQLRRHHRELATLRRILRKR